MDEEVSNGASETNTSSTTVLSRKGLFGKSGLVNDTFDTSIAVEKYPIVSSRETPNRDNEEESRTDVSASNSNDAQVPSHGNEVLERQSEQSADEEVAGEAHKDDESEGTDVPTVKESGDFASKEHEKSNIELDARDQHLDNKVPEKDPIVNSEETHHQDNDDSKNDDSMQGNPHSDITSPRSPNDSLSPRSPQNVPSSGPPCNVSSPGSPHDKPSPGSPHDKPSSGSPHDKPSPGSPHDTPSPGHNGKDVPTTVEEICVKKIISMDTDDTEKEQIGGASPSSDVEVQVKDDDVRDTTAITENTTEDERMEDNLLVEDESVESDPSADVLRESSSNFKDKDSEVQDISEGSSQTDEKSITEKMDVDKVSGQDDTEAKAEMPERKEDVDEAKDQSATEAKAEVPKRRSSTRHAATPQAENKTPTRVATSGRKVKAVSTIKKKNEENESAPESVGDGDNSSIVEEKDSSNRKSMRPRSRRSNVKDSVKTELSTPSSQKKGRRSAKLDVGIPNENNDDRQEASDDVKKKVDTSDKDSSRRSFRRRSAKQLVKIEDTPKSDARSGSSSKNKNKISVEKESAESQEGDTPRRRKKGGDPEVMKKSDRSSKTIFKKEKESKQRSHDPYDIETEMEKHPEPLKNIQMEVQSFGEVKYAKVGSGKYERTEKTAELRVGNLADMTPRTKQRKSLADLTPGRKKASPVVAGSNTAPQPRRSRKSKQDVEDSMEVEENAVQDSTPKKKTDTVTPKSGSRSSGKRRASPQTSVPSPKRPHIALPELSAEDLLGVDHPHDEHAPYEPGARVYAIFDGLFYPAIVISRDGLGRFKVNFVEDDVVKDVPPAGVIPLRALDRDKDCYFSDGNQKDRLAARVVRGPNANCAVAWMKAEFELEQLNDEGEPTGKKFKAVWTNLALSKDDWRDYINKKSREATDIISENIENTEDRQLRRSRGNSSSKAASAATPKPTTKVQKSPAKSLPSSRTKTSSKGGNLKNESSDPPTAKSTEKSDGKHSSAPGAGDEQIFAGKLFILTSANRPNTDTGFKKKFMTDFISTHGGLVVDDMKEVDEHPNMERFLVSDTHYRTHKYLAALVRAMPCVSHEWIYKCLDEKKLVDYKPFLLPSGVSILDEKEYPLPTERGVLLRNKKVMVHSNVTPPSKKSMSFEQIWVPMVPQLGGEIVSDIPDEVGKLDILLTDHSATASMVEKARKIGCAVVSSEWLIQGIIMDRLPDVNAHQKFLHNGGVCT